VISTDEAQRLNLAPGTPITSDLAAAIAAAQAAMAMRDAALRVVARRAVSRAELVRTLARRGFTGAPARDLADDFARRGFINEAAYAEALAAGVLRSRPAGAGLVRRKLAQRGLPRDVADRATREAMSGRDTAQSALDLANTLLAKPSLQRADPQARYRRIAGALARRGFDPDDIARALSRALRPTPQHD
jgi:regulatory protein